MEDIGVNGSWIRMYELSEILGHFGPGMYSWNELGWCAKFAKFHGIGGGPMGSLWIKSPLGLTGNLRCQDAPAPCYRVDVSRGAQSVVPMAWAGRNVEDLHRWQVLSVAPYFSTWYLVSVYGDVQIILPLWILPQFQRQPPHDWLVCLFCLGRIWLCHIGIVFTNMTHGKKAEQRTASRTWNSLQMKSWCGFWIYAIPFYGPI